MIEYKQTGDDLLKELQSLKGKLKAKALRSGLVAAAKPIKQSMRANAPVGQGSLQKSIGHITVSKTAKARLGYRQDDLVLLVGPTKKVAQKVRRHGRVVVEKWGQGRKANWLEDGVSSHLVAPKVNLNRRLGFNGQGVMSFGSGGAQFFAGIAA